VDAEDLFVRHFLPLYPPDARLDLARARALDANPGRNPTIERHLNEAAERFVANAPAIFGADLNLDRSDESVHRLSARLTRARRDAWISAGRPGSPDSPLFNVVVHGSAYLGACIVQTHGGVWGVRRPLWESVVRLKSRLGEGDLAVFHWWLKSLTDEALPPEQREGAEPAPAKAATLADRYRSHVEVPCARSEDLPILVRGERTLPRLKEPTYDRLHKFLRAHLPELRDLGRDFPTAERFASYDFRWIQFHTLGGGRVVMMAAASPHGLHLFWLGAEGFEKSVFVACDVFPDPIVRPQGERVRAMTSEGGESRVHEWLWWGP
jgi:hypothetical protein